jgi:hypothetical protein
MEEHIYISIKTGTNVEGENHTLFSVTTSPLAGRDWSRQKYQSE